MTVDGVLSHGRDLAEELMTDACTIRRVTGEALDANHDLTPTYSTVYAGKCRIRPRQTQDRMLEQGGDDVGVADLVVSVPIAVTGVEPGDLVDITVSTYDPDAVGRTYTVLGSVHGSQVTARRLTCQEVR